jgi:hypothetical protein
MEVLIINKELELVAKEAGNSISLSVEGVSKSSL